MSARVYQLKPQRQEKEFEKPETTAKILDITPRIRKRKSGNRRANSAMIFLIVTLLAIVVGALLNAQHN